MSERKIAANNIASNKNITLDNKMHPLAKKLHRTRQFYRLGLDAHREQLAIEQARALRKRGQRYQVSYTYIIENENRPRAMREKRIVRTEQLREHKRKRLETNEPGSLEYFLANNLLNYSDEERSRVKLLNVSVLPMITDLTPVETMFQFMNRFVLTPEWFRYMPHVAPISLEENDQNCVASGLTHLLLNPIRGRPTKHLPNPWGATQLKSVTALLDHIKIHGKEPNKPGYSSSCLHKFLKKLQINHYAFDAEGENFLVCTEFNSDHKAPIIWLVHNGHCYFVTSKEATKSVAEAAKAIKGPPRKPEQKQVPDPESLRFFEGQIEEVISGGLDSWEPGIYLCDQPDLQEAYELYVSCTRNEGLRPIQIDANERVSEFSVKTKKGKITFVANPDEGITDAPDLKRAADKAGLTFKGQSLAKLINDILNAPHARMCLTIEQKDEIVVKQKGKCACCGEKLVKKKIEFDHRKALANGGTNAVDNFQALCPSCHQDKTSHELHAGYTFRSSFASILHPQMQEELLRQESNPFLSYARVEFIGELKWIPNPDRQIDPDAPALDDYVIEHPDLAEADMVKCRRHLQGGYHYDTKYFDWPVYTLIDLPRPYSGQLQCGLFYVETTLDLGPFRGNGWHFECSCIWALNRGLITQQDIHLEWIPSRSVPHDHFRPLIQQLLDAFAFNEDLQKRAPNYFVGMCNKMTKKSRSVKMSLSKDEAGTWLARKDFSFVRKLDLPCGTGLYMGTFVSEVTLDMTCRLIYQMILQMEAIEVENLRAIVQQWAPPYSLKTDAVQFEEPGQVEAWEMQDWVRQQFWDQEHTIPKYRYVVADTVKPLARPAMADFVRE